MGLKCPPSFWDGTMSDNARAIWLWKFTYYRKEIPIGAKLILPVEDQGYRFKGVRLWQYRDKDGRREITYTFESDCVLCAAPFEFRVPSYFKTLVRTCSKHRRAWRTRTAAPKPDRKPATRDAFSHMGKAQLALYNVCKGQETNDLDAAIKQAQALLAARGDHVLKGNLVRAYRQLIKRGALDPCN